MSDGIWNYEQYSVQIAIEELEQLSSDELEELDAITQSNYFALIAELKKCYIHMQRLDWLLSGDDGQETYHERLAEDLAKLL